MTTQAATVLSTEAQRAFDAYVADNHGDLSDIVHFAQVMFNAGGRVAIKASVEFSTLPADADLLRRRVGRLCHLLDSFK